MAGTGTQAAGFNEADSNILLSKDLMKHRQFLQTLVVISTALFCTPLTRKAEVFCAIHIN
jgi:hypothetical protein